MLKVRATNSFSDSELGCVDINSVFECDDKTFERISSLVEVVDGKAKAEPKAKEEAKAEPKAESKKAPAKKVSQKKNNKASK